MNIKDLQNIQWRENKAGFRSSYNISGLSLPEHSNIKFPRNFLKEFHDFLFDLVHFKNILISHIIHNNYCERFTFNRDEDFAEIDFFYNARQSFTKAFIVRYNSENIIEDIRLAISNPGANHLFPAAENDNSGYIYLDKGIEIDVDGSFRNGYVSYAVIIRKDGAVIKKLSGVMDNAGTDLSIRQVAGELNAVIEAVKYCKSENIKEAHFYYDYTGIEEWATGKWKTNKKLTKEYSDFMKSCGMNIKWHKIKSHTGVKWNEEADRLANEAIEKKKTG